MSFVSLAPFPQPLAIHSSVGEDLIRSREHWYLGISAEKYGVLSRPGPPRPDQVFPKGDWKTWLVLAGRGAGKTRLASECAIDYAFSHPHSRIGVIAPTIGDCRSILFEGESGILANLPGSYTPRFNRTLLELEFPNGAFLQGFGADEPKRLRGPNFHFAICDELASWKSKKTGSQKEHAWDMLAFCLRLGDDPRVIVTTTPKPIALIKELINDPTTHLTRVSSYVNRANLAPSFFEKIIKKYEGTRLGRQELEALIIDTMDGALWSQELIDDLRIELADLPSMKRILVAVDPAATSGEEADDTGIVGVGAGIDDHGYVLADESCHEKPNGWATKAIALYHRLEADAIVAEINNGGEMVANTIHMIDPNIKVITVTASRGKHIRAEPISTVYEQKRVHHAGTFPELEEQMTNFNASGEYGLKGSPDRMDAMVWGFTELLVEGFSFQGVLEFYKQEQEKVKEELKKQIEKSMKTLGPGQVGKMREQVGITSTLKVPGLPPRPLAQDPSYIRRMLGK